LVTLLLVLALTSVPAALGQAPRANGQPQDEGIRPVSRAILGGQKVKVKGTIESQDADTFSVRDERNMQTVVQLTERTSIKTKGGFFRSGKTYGPTTLVRGLAVEVEGFGNQGGQLVADKVRFDSSDLKFARMMDTRVSPVENANRRLSGQVDELGEVTKLASAEAGRAHERISSLDDYQVQNSATVYFRVNSSVLSPEERRALDALAQSAANIKGYVIEVAGYADSTGNVARNRTLSQQRADAVVRYLQENHEIPLRRIVTPFGYGQLRPVAENTTAEGRRQNRRVEVKVLVSRGMTASGQ
jgi:outer membrane protein OmpA-like peptidoglycan-associated protein